MEVSIALGSKGRWAGLAICVQDTAMNNVFWKWACVKRGHTLFSTTFTLIFRVIEIKTDCGVHWLLTAASGGLCSLIYLSAAVNENSSYYTVTECTVFIGGFESIGVGRNHHRCTCIISLFS
jgi:hypothetical protein